MIHSTMSASAILEPLLLGSTVLALIADVASSAGATYNAPLVLYGLIAVHTRNARGALFFQLLVILTLLLDIIFLSVWASSRPAAAIAFVAMNLILKLPIIFYAHRFLGELGASYSWHTPVTLEASGSGSGAKPSGGSYVDGAALTSHDTASTSAGVDSSAYGGAYQQPIASAPAGDVYKSYQS